MNIVFFQVKDPKTKLLKLVETAQSHFEKKEHFLIFVEDDKALHFVDELLWKSPSYSFLPHVTTDFETKERVAITKTKANLNQAKVAFNLCSTPLLIEGAFRILYEYEDLTSPNKKRLSEIRFDAYRKAGYPIQAF